MQEVDHSMQHLELAAPLTYTCLKKRLVRYKDYYKSAKEQASGELLALQATMAMLKDESARFKRANEKAENLQRQFNKARITCIIMNRDLEKRKAYLEKAVGVQGKI